LVLTAGLSLVPVEEALMGTAQVLLVVSVAIWLLAAASGRWLCRRALVPVTRMAQAARDLNTVDLGWRLPEVATRDELHDLGDAFNGLLARLEEAFERQRRFTGDASHQLRTPLTAMRGQIDVALRRDRSPDEYRAALSRVRDQAEHLTSLVEMLLFLARADAEAKLCGLESIELGPWVEEHLGLWRNHPRSGDVRLALPSDEPTTVCVHPPLLGQLLDNLLDNACKYSMPGSLIDVRVERSDDGVALSVEDHGHGIAPEDLPRIFEPFYRASAAVREGRAGVGLGLSVAQRIAMVFGGRLTATGELGRGTRFELMLPEAPPGEGRQVSAARDSTLSAT
jgi:signal transduction histidine kinase